MKPTTITLALRGTDEVTRLVVEPWAGEYGLNKTEDLEVELTGDPALPIRVEIVGHRLIVCCFDSAAGKVKVMRKGVDLAADHCN